MHAFSVRQNESRSHEQETKHTLKLDPAKPVLQELADGKTDSYEISVQADQLVEALVEPISTDVRVTFSGPKGFTAITAESPYGVQGPVPVLAFVKEAGSYEVAVHSTEKNASSGRYRITMRELRTATATDIDKAAAWKFFAEGQQLTDQRTADSLRKAAESFERALPMWRKVGDQSGEAETLQELAGLYNNAGDNEKALKYLADALRLFQSASDRRGEALALTDTGSIQSDLGENQKALEYLSRALEIRQTLGDRASEGETVEVIAGIYENTEHFAQALENYNRALTLGREVGDRDLEAAVLDDIGVLYHDQDEMQKSLEYHTQALLLKRLLLDKFGEAQTLNSIGSVYSSLGEKKKAGEYFDQSLALKRATGNRQAEAKTLNNLGWFYITLGETQKALDYLNQAEAILHAAGNRLDEGISLNHIGSVYVILGDQEKARRYYVQALGLERAAGNHEWENIVLNNMGVSYFRDGNPQKALENYELALPISKAIEDHDTESGLLANIGKAHADLGNKKQALEYFESSLAVARKFDLRRREGITLYDLGWLYAKSGESQKALDSFNAALVLSRAVEDRHTEVSVLLGTARAERDLQDLPNALHHIEAAIKLIESLRTKVASQAFRTSYFASVEEYYDFYVSLLMQLHKLHPSDRYDARALEASERARGRSLLETLTEARAEIRQGVDPQLVERERSLQELLDTKSETRMRLLGGKHTAQQAETTAREIDELLAQYQEIEGRIRVASPRYAALMQPQPLNLEEIQRQLDHGSVLLEYSLGKEQSYLWAITPDSITSIELPPRKPIEDLVWRIYSAMSAGRSSEADSSELSRILLVPVVEQLANKRLLIVANGALQYIPFAALPEPVPIGGDHQAVPLVVAHEIVALPSASIVSALRFARANRSSAVRRLAVIADPVYDTNDSRVAENKEAEKRPGTLRYVAAAPSVAEAGITRDCQSGLRRLPYSRREGEAIVALAPNEEKLVAYGFAANVRIAQSPELAQYQYVHLAVHGCVDRRHPELSGLAFSQVGRDGRPQDGVLRLHQIYNLKLNAELVVLSACETGLGKDIKGEGLVGLTQGFMYAGSPRVAVSLWSVNDMATAELMRRFYKGMLLKRMSPPAALRAAQIEMWKQKRWRLPFYWAPFVIEGEWR